MRHRIAVAAVSAGSLNHAIAGGIDRRARRAGAEIEPFVHPRIAEHRMLAAAVPRRRARFPAESRR